MIVTCASCLTKFNLDESKIPDKGARVRCSRCQHVFYVAPPPETKEEILEDFESFAKFHEDLIGHKKKGEEEEEIEEPPAKPGKKEEEEIEEPPVKPGKKEIEIPSLAEKEEEKKSFDFLDKEPEERVERPVFVEENESRPKVFRPSAMARKERKRPSFLFILVSSLLLLVFGFSYLWMEARSGGRLPSFLDSPMSKLTSLWDQIWGTDKGTLEVSDLNGYEERVGDTSIYIIEGKVINQSPAARKHVKIRVMILTQDKTKIAEKEAICGRVLGREELKGLLPTLEKEEVVIKPQKQKEMMAPSGKSVPFMVIFKDLSGQAKEFKVEIVEAPLL